MTEQNDNDHWRRVAFRYCPKCGAAALTFVGRKLVRCEACGFELYFNAVAAVAALIVDAQGRLLITVRGTAPKQGTWGLPGGFVDPGETVEEGLRREVREELGLEVTSLRYLASYPNVYEYLGVRYATADLGFVCEVDDAGQARPCEEAIEAVLFKRPEEIDIGRFGFASVGRLVQCYLAGDGRA